MMIPGKGTEMAKKSEPKLSGRAVADEKGNQKWVWQSDGDDVDTAVVRSLGEGLTLDGSSPGSSQQGANPYDQGKPASARDATSKRRTLDDMRKLSETIKRSKPVPGK